MRQTRGFFFFILTFLIQNFSFSHDIDTLKYISIETLLNEETVNAEITGLGGYSGDCMQIMLENNSTDSVFIWIEGGRRLGSEDSTEQDIFIVKNLIMALGPLAKDSSDIFGFCCQSKFKSPKEKSKFNVGTMAPVAWIILANFIEVNDFPVGAIQKAVWVMSDNHEIGSVHDEDEDKVAPLKRKLAQLKGIEVPWYSFTYLEDESNLFSNEYETVFGYIDFSLTSSSLITVFIKDEQGFNVKYLIREMAYGPGDYTIKMKANIIGWKPGKYTIWIYQDEGVPNKKQTFYLK